ncbi:MAG: deoxyribose-phosphate aldolase [archaeon]
MNKKIDYTNLNRDTTEEEIVNFCNTAKEYSFKSVCVNPNYTALCSKLLKDSPVKVDTVIGFPLGQNTTKIKLKESVNAIENNTDELDIVINVSKVKDKDYDFVEKEIDKISDTIKHIDDNIVIKFIIESGYLTLEEIKKVCKIIDNSQADFVKNSTGFKSLGANVPHIFLMDKYTGEDTKVKASGGIHNYQDALVMLIYGADRLGASKGKQIINSLPDNHMDLKEKDIDICKYCLPPERVKKDDTIIDYYLDFCDV